MRHQYRQPAYIMFGMGSCPYCKKALRLLNERYGRGQGTIIDVVHDTPPEGTWERDLVEKVKARQMTVPQIFLLSQTQPNSYMHIGGYTDLAYAFGVQPE